MSYNDPPPPSYPSYGAPQYGAPQYAVPVANPYVISAHPGAVVVNDFLIWSIINLFIGWGFGGFLPLIFSLVCRNYKAANNYSGAQSMSTLALVFNILVTIGGGIGWIVFIIVMSIAASY